MKERAMIKVCLQKRGEHERKSHDRMYNGKRKKKKVCQNWIGGKITSFSFRMSGRIKGKSSPKSPCSAALFFPSQNGQSYT
jgi:hypothetical protein